jgi:hypothetical protein
MKIMNSGVARHCGMLVGYGGWAVMEMVVMMTVVKVVMAWR